MNEITVVPLIVLGLCLSLSVLLLGAIKTVCFIFESRQTVGAKYFFSLVTLTAYGFAVVEIWRAILSSDLENAAEATDTFYAIAGGIALVGIISLGLWKLFELARGE